MWAYADVRRLPRSGEARSLSAVRHLENSLNNTLEPSASRASVSPSERVGKSRDELEKIGLTFGPGRLEAPRSPLSPLSVRAVHPLELGRHPRTGTDGAKAFAVREPIADRRGNFFVM